MNLKLIVTDLDHTLLRSDLTISKHTIAIFDKCRTNKIKIVFATARSTQASAKFLDMFTPDVFIGYGGALVLTDGKAINRFAISADHSYKLINECMQETDIKSILAINEYVAHTNRLDNLDTASAHYQWTDFSIRNNLDYLKISLVAADPGIVERIAANYPMLDMLRYSGEDLYRFADREAVKWNAVKAVADYYDIGIDSVVAFGDDINDQEMVKNCGIGVAVANAIDEVKAVADYICDSNDNDGVAKWLEENVL